MAAETILATSDGSAGCANEQFNIAEQLEASQSDKPGGLITEIHVGFSPASGATMVVNLDKIPYGNAIFACLMWLEAPGTADYWIESPYFTFALDATYGHQVTVTLKTDFNSSVKVSLMVVGTA